MISIDHTWSICIALPWLREGRSTEREGGRERGRERGRASEAGDAAGPKIPASLRKQPEPAERGRAGRQMSARRGDGDGYIRTSKSPGWFSHSRLSHSPPPSPPVATRWCVLTYADT